MQLLLLCFVSCVATVLATNPGVSIQLNQPFLTYAKSLGIGLLNKDLPGTHIPDVNGKKAPQTKGLFSWWLSNIVINSFNAPDAASQVTIAAPHGIDFNIGSVSAAIHADYKIKVGSGWLSVTKSGTVDITASANANVNVQIDVANSRPHLTSSSCSATITNIDITFHGDLIDDIIDLFKGAIEDMVKDKLSGVICDELNTLLAKEANPLLQGIPITVNIYDGFQLDYSMTEAASVVSNTIMAPFLGRIWYTGHHDDANIPQAQPMTPTPNGNQHACFKLDVPAVLGSGAYAGIVSGKLSLDVDPTLLAGLGLPNLLKCNCNGGQCIGTYIPQVQKFCPAGGSISLIISMNQTTQLPRITTNSTGLFMVIDGQATIAAGGSNLLVLGATAGAVLPAANLKFDGWTIKGQVHATSGTISVISSTIGNISAASLETLWQIALIVLFEKELNTLAEKGVTLPNIPHVTVLNPAFTFGDRTLELCANLQISV